MVNIPALRIARHEDLLLRKLSPPCWRSSSRVIAHNGKQPCFLINIERNPSYCWDRSNVSLVRW